MGLPHRGLAETARQAASRHGFPVLSAAADAFARAERLHDAVVPVIAWNGSPRYQACFFVTPLPVSQPQAAVGTR